MDFSYAARRRAAAGPTASASKAGSAMPTTENFLRYCIKFSPSFLFSDLFSVFLDLGSYHSTLNPRRSVFPRPRHFFISSSRSSHRTSAATPPDHTCLFSPRDYARWSARDHRVLSNDWRRWITGWLSYQRYDAQTPTRAIGDRRVWKNVAARFDTRNGEVDRG
jgi:hypothetical protein